MGKPKFSLMDKTLNPEIVDGKMNAFVKVPYGIQVRLSHPLGKDGYGRVTVDGIPISRGKIFKLDMVIKADVLYLPVGEVAREFDREYTLALTGFKTAEGVPYPDCSFKIKTTAKSRPDPAFAENDEVALEAAREGMVLLRNEKGVLPLKEGAVLNCFGRGQYMYRNTSTGASMINPRWQPDFMDAIKEHSSFSVNEELSALYCYLQDVTPGGNMLERAKEQSDTAVILISRTSGEFLDNHPDKGSYYLTDDEEAMIKAVTAVFDKTVAIINSGFPMDIAWTQKYGIDAVVYTGFTGMLSSYALMEILDGRTNPSGKLRDTWARDYYDSPAAHNFINFKEVDEIPGEKDKGVRLYYEEDIYVGYRYFDSFGKAPAYSFGHGLSYTDFALETGKPSFDGNNVTLQVTITNTGKRAGKETAQLYLHAPEGKLEKPYRVLAAFEKTKELKPGEKELLALTACASDFASFDEETGSYLLEAGTYEVYCGNSLAKAVLAGCFTVGKTETLRTVERVCRPVEEFKRLNRENGTAEAVSQLVDLDQRIRVRAPRPSYQPLPLKKHTGKKIIYAQVKENPGLMDEFVSQMSDKELCRMNVCGGSNWYLPWQNGEAGKTNVIKKYKMPRMLVSDGNTGINVKKKNIGMPCSASIAATFNKELAYRVGSVIAKESKAQNIYQNLGPGMNIHRNVLNGRHPEYFSEDPYLAGMMAGMHAKGLEDNGVGSCYKHMFCNNSDTSRKGSHSIVSERALREIYFRVFEVAIAVQKPSAVMTSYNAVNGIYPAENADVIQKLIRGEWGIDGMVMTDWGTYDTVDAVEMVKAGNCWLTEGSKKYSRLLEQAVKEGRLSRAVLERNVRSVISTMLKRV